MNNQNGQETTWISTFFEYLKSILDKYMQHFDKSEELTAFMENEQNLYNNDGSLTHEYQNWIKRFEVFCMDHPIDEFLESEHKGSMNRIEFLRGAKEYLAHRQELKDKYANSENGEEWLNAVLDSEEKRQAFETLIDKELEHEINNISSDNNL